MHLRNFNWSEPKDVWSHISMITYIFDFVAGSQAIEHSSWGRKHAHMWDKDEETGVSIFLHMKYLIFLNFFGCVLNNTMHVQNWEMSIYVLRMIYTNYLFFIFEYYIKRKILHRSRNLPNSYLIHTQWHRRKTPENLSHLAHTQRHYNPWENSDDRS